jgi:biopolymer transport protein ExbD
MALVAMIAGCESRHDSDSLEQPVLEAAPPEMIPPDQALLVTLPDSGGVYLNGRRVPVDSLTLFIGQIATAMGFKAIFLRADRSRPGADVRTVIAAADKVGVNTFDANKSGFPREEKPPSAGNRGAK